MKKIFFILPLLAVILFSNISHAQKLVPFTSTLQEKYGLTKAVLKSIQFYVSEEVVLTKELTGSKNEVVAGKIKLVNNKRVDEVVIKSKTRCLIIDTNTKGHLKLAFSSNDENTLTFGLNKETKKYILLAENWQGRVGTVNYGAEKYQTGGYSYDACLLVKLKDIRKVKHNKKVEKGRKL